VQEQSVILHVESFRFGGQPDADKVVKSSIIVQETATGKY
jgi:hypothetical protein